MSPSEAAIRPLKQPIALQFSPVARTVKMGCANSMDVSTSGEIKVAPHADLGRIEVVKKAKRTLGLPMKCQFFHFLKNRVSFRETNEICPCLTKNPPRKDRTCTC